MTETRAHAWIFFGLLSRAMAALAPPAPDPGITLSWCDPHRLFPSGRQEVGKELHRTFGELEVPLRFTRGAVPKDGSAGYERRIQVVLVRSDPGGWRLPSTTMGAVLSRNGLSTEVYVFFDAVARTLGYPPEVLKKRWPTAREKRELSRALARVIAHEVMHVVLPGRDHAEAGLTRGVLSREALLDPDEEIDSSVAEAFRFALLRR